MKYTPDHKYNKSNELLSHLLEGKELPRT